MVLLVWLQNYNIGIRKQERIPDEQPYIHPAVSWPLHFNMFLTNIVLLY